VPPELVQKLPEIGLRSDLRVLVPITARASQGGDEFYGLARISMASEAELHSSYLGGEIPRRVLIGIVGFKSENLGEDLAESRSPFREFLFGLALPVALALLKGFLRGTKDVVC
jgi:hypothetical protein